MQTLCKPRGVSSANVAKSFAGARLRRLREERGLTQVALARALGLSTSYVNQLENDQRPMTVSVLLAVTERFDLPPQYFAADSDARLIADLREILVDERVTPGQIEELVARMPEVGQTLEVYRVKQLPGPNKAPPSYRRDLVGHVKIDHVFDDHFAHVTVADGTPAKHDIVELRKN